MNTKKHQKCLSLANLLNKTILAKKLAMSNDSILILISGGQDSTCLVFLVAQLKRQWKWNLRLLWCNHLWQKNSFFTARNVFKFCFLLPASICLAISTTKMSSEKEGRKWRYSLINRIKTFNNDKIVMTGHTGSDRIETFLFHLLRGSGRQGLSSLNWSIPIDLQPVDNIKIEELSKNCYSSLFFDLEKTICNFPINNKQLIKI